MSGDDSGLSGTAATDVDTGSATVSTHGGGGEDVPANVSEPLSVSSGVIGLVAASNQTHNDLLSLNSLPEKETTAIDSAARSIKIFKLTAQMLYKLLRRFELGTLRLQQRPVLIDIDVLVAVLTEAILAVSELGNQLADVVRQAEGMDVSPMRIVARYGESIRRDEQRIWVVERVITKLASVLELGSEIEALRYRAQAEETIGGMLESNHALASRMSQMQDIFGARALIPRERLNQIAAFQAPPEYSVPAPSADDDDGLPDYVASADSTTDVTLPVQTGIWSSFSGLAITDVKLLSLVPLPLTTGELHYGERFYTAAYTTSINEALGQLVEKNTKYKTKALKAILGLQEVVDPRDKPPAPSAFGE